MTTYAEVAQALANAGYLTDPDLEAAAIVLQDALIVDAAEDAEAEAVIDAAYAAAALLAAELIDEVNLEAAAAVIADAWDEE